MRLKHIDAAGREVVIKESGDISALKSAASAYPRGNSELIIWQSGPSGGSAFDIPVDAPAICTFSDGSKFIIG